MVSSHVAASITLPPTFTEGHIDFEVTGLNPAHKSYWGGVVVKALRY
jgi:hypothetical protein